MGCLQPKSHTTHKENPMVSVQARDLDVAGENNNVNLGQVSNENIGRDRINQQINLNVLKVSKGTVEKNPELTGGIFRLFQSSTGRKDLIEKEQKQNQVDYKKRFLKLGDVDIKLIYKGREVTLNFYGISLRLDFKKDYGHDKVAAKEFVKLAKKISCCKRLKKLDINFQWNVPDELAAAFIQALKIDELPELIKLQLNLRGDKTQLDSMMPLCEKIVKCKRLHHLWLTVTKCDISYLALLARKLPELQDLGYFVFVTEEEGPRFKTYTNQLEEALARKGLETAEKGKDEYGNWSITMEKSSGGFQEDSDFDEDEYDKKHQKQE